MNSAISLQTEIADNSTIMDKVKDYKYSYKLELIEDSTNLGEYYKLLSKLEMRVLQLMVEGFNYKEIASVLDHSNKTIDNAIQRIRRKFKAAEVKDNKEKRLA